MYLYFKDFWSASQILHFGDIDKVMMYTGSTVDIEKWPSNQNNIFESVLM